MPRNPDVMPNRALRALREQRSSRVRSGAVMSRGEIAELLNAELRRRFTPEVAVRWAVDGRWVGDLENGHHRWPAAPRRAALLGVYGVRHVSELGLRPHRRSRVPVGDRQAAPSAGRPRSQAATTELPLVSSRPVPGPAAELAGVNVAGRHNYWLGGKDNVAVDRASGDRIAAALPPVVAAARQSRTFLPRVLHYAIRQAGIGQVLDLGCGLPAATENTHEIAQRLAPHARVVYVDHDPLVMAHARALLCGAQIGHVEADLRTLTAVLDDPGLTTVADLGRPVVVLLMSVLHYLPDIDRAAAVVRGLRARLAPGSLLAFSHVTTDGLDGPQRDRYEQMLAARQVDVYARTREQIEELATGLDLVEPGIVPVSRWRPTGRPAGAIAAYGVVGRITAPTA